MNFSCTHLYKNSCTSNVFSWISATELFDLKQPLPKCTDNISAFMFSTTKNILQINHLIFLFPNIIRTFLFCYEIKFQVSLDGISKMEKETFLQRHHHSMHKEWQNKTIDGDIRPARRDSHTYTLVKLLGFQKNYSQLMIWNKYVKSRWI